MGFGFRGWGVEYRGTSLIRNRPPPRNTIWPTGIVLGGVRFLMSEVPLYLGSEEALDGREGHVVR